MSAALVDLDGPWWAGPVICERVACYHEWVAVVNLAPGQEHPVAIECPACGCMSGLPVVPEDQGDRR